MERGWSLGYIFGNKLHRAVLNRTAEGRPKESVIKSWAGRKSEPL